METASTYYARRAQQERESAERAASAQARRAHLELAFRLVNFATDPVPWSPKEIDRAHGADPQEHVKRPTMRSAQFS